MGDHTETKGDVIIFFWYHTKQKNGQEAPTFTWQLACAICGDICTTRMCVYIYMKSLASDSAVLTPRVPLLLLVGWLIVLVVPTRLCTREDINQETGKTYPSHNDRSLTSSSPHFDESPFFLSDSLSKFQSPIEVVQFFNGC